MTNAYVLDDHHGDSGTVRAGAVLLDVNEDRFGKLKGQGLAREASAAEVKAAQGDKDVPTADEKQADPPKNKKAPEPTNKAAPASKAK